MSFAKISDNGDLSYSAKELSLEIKTRPLGSSSMRKKNKQQESKNSQKQSSAGSSASVRKEEERLLVERSRLGDKQAFRELVERYQQRAFRIAFDVVKNESDAEDVVQESFVKAYLHLKNFKGDSSFFTWLYRIVFNMAIDLKRKQGRRGGIPDELDEEKLNVRSPLASELVGSVEAPDAALFRKQQRRFIEEALEQLSDEHRAVIQLREIDGMRYEEISEVIGVSRGTVMSRLHYARKYLKEALGSLLSVHENGAEVVPFPTDISGKDVQK